MSSERGRDEAPPLQTPTALQAPTALLVPPTARWPGKGQTGQNGQAEDPVLTEASLLMICIGGILLLGFLFVLWRLRKGQCSEELHVQAIQSPTRCLNELRNFHIAVEDVSDWDERSSGPRPAQQLSRPPPVETRMEPALPQGLSTPSPVRRRYDTEYNIMYE